MKLITHNLLLCNRKTCINVGVKNFPLKLTVQEYKDYDDESALECNKNLMKRLLEKVEWQALRETVSTVSTRLDLVFNILRNCLAGLGRNSTRSLFRRYA